MLSLGAQILGDKEQLYQKMSKSIKRMKNIYSELNCETAIFVNFHINVIPFRFPYTRKVERSEKPFLKTLKHPLSFSH